MNKIYKALAIAALMIAASCTNMNPDVKFDPQVDAEAYCEIGKKDSKIANEFWDKVEAAYMEKMMYAEYQEFERIIIENSQIAVQEKPVRDAMLKSDQLSGEVSYYPEKDAKAYLEMMATDKEIAQRFHDHVVECYNTDGLYEDLEIFMEMCGTKTE